MPYYLERVDFEDCRKFDKKKDIAEFLLTDFFRQNQKQKNTMSIMNDITLNDFPKTCAAKKLSFTERKDIAIEALTGSGSVSSLARENEVSRKFVYKQKTLAEEGIDSAFKKKNPDVLFYLPVTKQWLEQLIFCLVLICHSSYRGVQEIFSNLFDLKISVGSVHNVLHQGIEKVQILDKQEELSKIEVGAHDEIFQGNTPVLAGCDPHSLYCYLLTTAEHRDGDTWALELMECQNKGFAPDYTVADFGSGLRAGQKQAMPSVPCFGDHFHVLYDFNKLISYLENRAYRAMSEVEKIIKKMERAKKKGKGASLSRKLGAARAAQLQAIMLADEVQILFNWTQELLSPVGYDYTTRKELFSFIIQELKAKEAMSRRIPAIRKLLENNNEEILHFAKKIDVELETLAKELDVDNYIVRKMYELQGMPKQEASYYHLMEYLRQQLRWKFHMVEEAVNSMLDSVVRASSAVENFNSRLRNYFFLRKNVGSNYLVLLRFFLNHRKFLASESSSRKGRSPAEIMLKKEQKHWLEQLGYTPFKQAA